MQMECSVVMIPKGDAYITHTPGCTGKACRRECRRDNSKEMRQSTPARENKDKAPLILWLNGIPGQAPIFGSSGGMSPCTPLRDGGMVTNPFSWNRKAHLLFFDMVPFNYSI
ncbi:hypothetical protein DSO57_1012243 [Entomophthora muscae]|uniref:Uncharacterized protein n=1 Tax=Entomophthora muscae TaxID=34485 RepID=A0ACC2S7Y9_9FUNG|nr:hypothetical protein DSO57_1012243 [Entomophthora muscae]